MGRSLLERDSAACSAHPAKPPCHALLTALWQEGANGVVRKNPKNRVNKWGHTPFLSVEKPRQA
jgi:hypothetical protein